jgi:poly-gamma-glutamate synthesis protein (capsule biosynthesis protein)
MLHGGNEYQSEPTVAIERMIAAARESGATLVLNHHSHVLGGLHWHGGTLVAKGLGNFLFDQTLWKSFPSLLLEVHLHRGAVQRVVVYPLLLQRYRPHAAVGPVAMWILRGIAARSEGNWLIAGGVLELDLAQQSRIRKRWLHFQGAQSPSGIAALRSGSRLCGWRGTGHLELGRSLIGVGDFEDRFVGVPSGDAGLWALFHRDQRLEPAAARRGRFGVRLRRSAVNQQSVLLRPLHRLPVQPGQRLTYLAWVRGNAGAQARLHISWYQGLRGSSVARLTHPIQLQHHWRWQPVRLDLQVPDHVSAMGPAIALDPPVWGLQSIDIDDVELVLWQQPERPDLRHADWIRSDAAGEVCISEAIFPSQQSRGAALQTWP